jgi:hypothetical protein
MKIPVLQITSQVAVGVGHNMATQGLQTIYERPYPCPHLGKGTIESLYSVWLNKPNRCCLPKLA